MLEPDLSRFILGLGLDSHQVQLVLAFRCQTLTHGFHVLRAININQLCGRRERAECETLVELAFEQLHLNQLNNTVDVHVGHLVVAVDAKVGTGNDFSDLQEVEAFESDRNDSLLVAIAEAKFIETLALLVDLDPRIVGDIA